MSKPDITSLRSTIEWLRKEGLLIETDKEVSPDLEITALQKHFDGSLPILFNNVKGYPHTRAITNLFAETTVMDRMFGFSNPTERTRAIAKALNKPLKPAKSTCPHRWAHRQLAHKAFKLRKLGMPPIYRTIKWAQRPWLKRQLLYQIKELWPLKPALTPI